jgi:nitrite reductase/ring-hydroxylating ferredoxin subunit
MKWIKIEVAIPAHDFVQQIKLNGKKLCLIKHQGQVHVTQNTCPHAGGLLSGGWCKEGKLICPIHRYAYNLDNGRGAAGQGDYIDIYPTEVRADGMYVGFEEGFWTKIFG